MAAQYGKMTAYLLAQLVGDPTNPYAVMPLSGIPMWWGVFTSDPLVATDPLAVELGGVQYARPAAAWTTFGVTGLVNSAEGDFFGIPPGTTLTSIGLFDAEINGNLLAADNFDAPLTFPVGGSWILPVSEFFLGFDLSGL